MHEHPARRARPSDAAGLQALAIALHHCDRRRFNADLIPAANGRQARLRDLTAQALAGALHGAAHHEAARRH